MPSHLRSSGIGDPDRVSRCHAPANVAAVSTSVAVNAQRFRGSPGAQRSWRACGNQHIRPRPGRWRVQRIGRRVEVIADGLPGHRHHSCHRCTETARPGGRGGNSSGVALHAGRRVKEATYPELPGEAGRARSVVRAAEVGGCWSHRSSSGTWRKAAPLVLQGRVQAAHLRRWSSLLACSLARAFAVVGETARAKRPRGRSFIGRCSERRQDPVASHGFL